MNESSGSIRYIIFDLGNVLIDIHPERTMGTFARKCHIPVAEFQKLFLSPLHLRFMKSDLTPREFYQAVLERYPCQLSFEEFFNIWLELIGDLKEGMSALLKALSTRYTLALCSNTDPIHWQRVIGNNPEMQLFRHYYLSFQLKLLKPDSAIFEYIVQDLQTRPAECVFIDDTEANTVAAKQIGFRTIRAATCEEIRRRFQQLKISGT